MTNAKGTYNARMTALDEKIARTNPLPAEPTVQQAMARIEALTEEQLACRAFIDGSLTKIETVAQQWADSVEQSELLETVESPALGRIADALEIIAEFIDRQGNSLHIVVDEKR